MKLQKFLVIGGCILAIVGAVVSETNNKHAVVIVSIAILWLITSLLVKDIEIGESK